MIHLHRLVLKSLIDCDCLMSLGTLFHSLAALHLKPAMVRSSSGVFLSGLISSLLPAWCPWCSSCWTCCTGTVVISAPKPCKPGHKFGTLLAVAHWASHTGLGDLQWTGLIWLPLLQLYFGSSELPASSRIHTQPRVGWDRTLYSLLDPLQSFSCFWR